MWSTTYLSAETETEDFDLFPPFAKRSREVNRHSDESFLSEQSQTLWRTEMPLHCEESFRPELFLAPDLFSSSEDGTMSRRYGVNIGLTHEKLPHPSKLMVRKRSQRGHGHAANVLQHIGELRMRQRHINQLKGDKWWGATAVFGPEEIGGPQEIKEQRLEQLLGLSADVSLNEILEDNPDSSRTKPYEAPYSPTHQFSFPGYEQFLELAPGGNPMMAFVAGTAHRSLLTADDAAGFSGGSDGILRSNDDNDKISLSNLEFF